MNATCYTYRLVWRVVNRLGRGEYCHRQEFTRDQYLRGCEWESEAEDILEKYFEDNFDDDQRTDDAIILDWLLYRGDSELANGEYKYARAHEEN